MKIKIILFIFLVIVLNVNSQENIPLGKVFLTNGIIHSNGYERIYNGMVKPTTIKYKTKDNLQFIHDSKKIEKVRDYYNNSKGTIDSTDYYYKYHKNKFKLIRKIKGEGKIELFAEDRSHQHNFNSFGITVSGTINKSSSYLIFYIGEKHKPKIEKLPRRKTSKKFKKTLLKYTSKCKLFTEKLNNKNFLQKNSIIEIIKYYNENCKQK